MAFFSTEELFHISTDLCMALEGTNQEKLAPTLQRALLGLRVVLTDDVTHLSYWDLVRAVQEYCTIAKHIERRRSLSPSL